ncbi:energy-coupling factor ABC transporter substrate-binding protein [Halanaerocella petrolearia]
MSLTNKNLILLMVIVVLVIAPLLINPKAEFGGADGTAQGIIKEVSPNYEPWFHVIWKPPSGEIESLLFALQAALGAGVIGYYIGLKQTKFKFKEREA